MERDPTLWVLWFWLVFLAACAGGFFQLAGDFARDHDRETSFMCISFAIMCLMYFVRLLPLYVQLRLDLVHDRNGSNGPPGPGPDSDSSAGQRGRQLNDHSSQLSRRGAGGGGSSTSSRYSTTTYPPSSGRYRDAILITIVLMTIIYYQFVSSRGNEYFCEIDEDYLTDRFNLTGLNTEVSYYQYALDLVTDVFDLDADDDLREQIEKSARHLYGLVHARYIVTTRGLAKMVC